jgi:hypothetical protein
MNGALVVMFLCDSCVGAHKQAYYQEAASKTDRINQHTVTKNAVSEKMYALRVR